MYKKKSVFMLSLLVLAVSAVLSPAVAGHGPKEGPSKPQITDGDTVYLAGTVLDPHHEPVPEAELMVVVNGEEVEHIVTSHSGHFVSHFQMKKGTVHDARIKITARKASFKAQSIQLSGRDLAQKGDHFYYTAKITMPRVLGPAFWISTVVFVLAYVLIAFELLHRTIAAMLGAALMMTLSYTVGTILPEWHILSFDAAIASIDMNVIFLLMGMMIIVGVLKHTGVFQWCAYMSYKLARGKVFILAIYLMIFTAVSSAFLDNVTTMLLLTGVAIEICISLSLNPLVMLIPLVLASNIGGTATLIGDPPNIMIGSYAGLTFMDFVIALALICGVSMIVLILFSKFVWGKDYATAKVENVEEYIQVLKKEYQITDPTLLAYGLGVLGFAVFLFLSHGYWHMEVSIAALMGASILLTIAILTKKVNLIEIIEKDIEWPTLMFFIFLFIIVGAVESSGLLALIADWILKLSQGDFVMACSLIIWVAAIMSAFVDNIPFTATMLPIVAYLSSVIPGAENTLWWALALGACFGGNGTIIGASANVVTMGIAESRGYKISFGGFMKVAFPYMVISVAIAHAWLLIFR
ncbi:MAG: ArsB/NhaD family transporter [Deltaproteobacteria bacterium]|nr:ArsB/NhaD family transporter [Deltaproteobacteria bacterium]MBW1951336.1 ArsB/NhaD family transporter [Deltaproteobacteria bacterium]MBW2009883.1 ArsB/NhaD family transporter [Deltaproteobacteria bacterium]